MQPGVADRWTVVSTGNPSLWTSTGAYVAPHTTYRCGAVVKDPTAKVQFVFQTRPSPKNMHPKPLIMPLPLDGKLRGELTTTLDANPWKVVAEVRSSRRITQAIENVWVVPEVDSH